MPEGMPWIPASAGMTQVSAGMTQRLVVIPAQSLVVPAQAGIQCSRVLP
jgi:hypothetical protein